MKKSHVKAWRLGIALMLVFGLFLPSCKKEIYPPLQNSLFSYQGNDPVIKEVVSELKKPLYGELRHRLGRHGSINWDDPKALLTSSFLEGLTLRFYSADSNYLDARINAKSKAVQLLDREELQAEETKAELKMQQASQAKAKKLGLNTMDVTIDPNWPLCNQPNTENLCKQVIDFELEIYYQISLGFIFHPYIMQDFRFELILMGYADYVNGKLTDTSQLKTRNDVINDVSLAWSFVVSRYRSALGPLLPQLTLLSVDVRSSCCPKKPVENLVGGSGVALLTREDEAALQILIQEDAMEDNKLAQNPICYGTGRTGNVKFRGTMEHWLIQYDYVTTVAGGVREYSIPTAGSSGVRAGFADIANTITGDMFEIKSEQTGPEAAAGEIANYVRLAGDYCPRPSLGAWRLGTGYATRYLKYPGELNSVLMAWSPAPGVVLYKKIAASNSPVPVPVLLPENLAKRIKAFIKYLSLQPHDLERKIAVFLKQNPEVRNYIKAAAAALVIATLAEDFITGGAGIFDDAASFNLARIMWRLASTIN